MTSIEHWSVDTFRKVFSALGKYINPLVVEKREQAKEMDSQDIFYLGIARSFAPDPMGLAHIFQRSPYTNPESQKQRLEDAAKRGWLQSVGDSAFTISEKGERFYADLMDAFKEKLAGVESLPEEELIQITALLDKVVEAARQNTDLLHKPALELSLKFKLDADISTLQKIRRKSLYLLSYRDDAHVASWSPHKLEGRIWEALSFVWEDKASTSAELLEKLDYRNYQLEDYEDAFEDLVNRGWIKEEEKGKFNITEEGKQVRQQAEDLTNQHYNAPWAALSQDETHDLQQRMKKLVEVLEAENENS